MSSIGIDLGTTNSCVAARVNGRGEVLENDNGQLITPSCVAFTKQQTLIGESAKKLLAEEPENTIYSVKRIIGRKFDDPKTQEDKKNWSFKVESAGGRPVIRIDHRRETFNPEVISGLVLDYMRRIACKKLDEDVRDAVVTVPAYFNHMQRSATKTAAELAGLKLLGMINEPTAAAIAFGLVKKYSGNRNILVYDFGGGTLDVTVLSIKGSEFDVKASSGNSRLGGDDLTNRLVEHFVKYVKTEMDRDIANDKRAKNKLLVECEKAKKELSFRFEYTLLIDNIVGGKTLRKSINRAKFVSLNKDLLDKTMDHVKDAVQESGMEKRDIHFVVPVGGSSKIPFVVEKLKNYFGEDQIKMDRNPEQTIAKGAAVYAAYLKGESVQEISEIRLSEVTPLSLCFEDTYEKAVVVIRRNTKIPVTESEKACNSFDYQKVVTFAVGQGEEKWFKDNEYLGEYKLDITPKLKGKVKIDVEFNLDRNGILHAKSTEKGVGRSESTLIDLCGTLEKLDIFKLKYKLKKLVSEEKQHEAQQEEVYHLQSDLNELSTHDSSRAIQKHGEILRWMDENPDASISELRKKRGEISKFQE